MTAKRPTSGGSSGSRPNFTDPKQAPSLVVTPEPPSPSANGNDENRGYDPGENLDDIKCRREKQRADRELQDAQRDGDLHGIRKSHTTWLLAITVGWLLLVWLVVMLQGFGQWFLTWFAPDPEKGESYLHFKLSDTVMVAFVTSTTATVLGLYGIAAYWLYGKKGSGASEKDDKPKRNSSAKNKGSKQKDDDNDGDDSEDI